MTKKTMFHDKYILPPRYAFKYCKWCEFNDSNDPASGTGVCQDYFDCPIHEKFWDWKDAALFEEKVTMLLTRQIEQGHYIYPPTIEKILKNARLAVEEEMP